MSDLELFRPKRMAQRILGMGDVVSLVEKVQQQVDEKQRLSMSENIKNAQFDLEDFLQSIQQIQKLGPMSALMKMLPRVLLLVLLSSVRLAATLAIVPFFQSNSFPVWAETL